MVGREWEEWSAYREIPNPNKVLLRATMTNPGDLRWLGSQQLGSVIVVSIPCLRHLRIEGLHWLCASGRVSPVEP